MTVEVTQLTVNRVVVNESGEAKSINAAAAQDGISPDVVFVRGDGWVLGAPKRFASVAFQMWRKEWTYFAKSPDWNLKPIVEYYQ